MALEQCGLLFRVARKSYARRRFAADNSVDDLSVVGFCGVVDVLRVDFSIRVQHVYDDCVRATSTEGLDRRAEPIFACRC